MAFKNIKARAVTRDATARFRFYRLEGQPVLTVKPCTEANPAYTRQALKGSKEQLRQFQSGDATPEMLEERRAKDRTLFPELVIVGWEDDEAPIDDKGKRVKYTLAECQEFVTAIPYDMFGELRDFCADNDNFRDALAIPESDRAAIAGNSQGGSSGS